MEKNYFTIDAQMPSLNDYQAACRANKYRGASFKEETSKSFYGIYSRRNGPEPDQTAMCAVVRNAAESGYVRIKV